MLAVDVGLLTKKFQVQSLEDGQSSSNIKLVSFEHILSYDIASGSEITPCNKIDKPLVVYRFSGNVLMSITTLRT